MPEIDPDSIPVLEDIIDEDALEQQEHEMPEADSPVTDDAALDHAVAPSEHGQAQAEAYQSDTVSRRDDQPIETQDEFGHDMDVSTTEHSAEDSALGTEPVAMDAATDDPTLMESSGDEPQAQTSIADNDADADTKPVTASLSSLTDTIVERMMPRVERQLRSIVQQTLRETLKKDKQ